MATALKEQEPGQINRLCTRVDCRNISASDGTGCVVISVRDPARSKDVYFQRSQWALLLSDVTINTVGGSPSGLY